MNKYDAQDRYRKWWRGKECRISPYQKFKMVADVKVYGPPSFVYGTAELVYEDGTTDLIPHGNAFRPRKIDVEVKPCPKEKAE